jgi:hypothetical protein
MPQVTISSTLFTYATRHSCDEYRSFNPIWIQPVKPRTHQATVFEQITGKYRESGCSWFYPLFTQNGYTQDHRPSGAMFVGMPIARIAQAALCCDLTFLSALNAISMRFCPDGRWCVSGHGHICACPAVMVTS